VPTHELLQALTCWAEEGAGAKGLSSLTVLGEVTDRVQEEDGLDEPPEIHECFEFVAGTDTGA
jgi:patatin-like phospholipase/acyl hydrolase